LEISIMRSATKSFVCCAAVVAAAGLALAQQGTEPKKPTGNTPPAGKSPAVTPPKESKPAANTPPTGGMDPKMMEEMMKAGQPGEMHKKLEPMVGTFDVVTKFRMDPSGEWQSSRGTATEKWALGNRFVQMSFDGQMMGGPFHGEGYLGYNNVTSEYESFWIDTWGTGMMYESGKGDGKTITLNGECADPTAGGKKTKMKSVWHITDNNSHSLEMFGADKDGKEFKMMEITYTRAGAGKPEAAKPSAPGNTPPKAEPKPVTPGNTPPKAPK
jgi:hypothetical protein